MVKCREHGDAPAHRPTYQVGTTQIEYVEQADRIRYHIAQRVLRSTRPIADRSACIAVVIANDEPGASRESLADSSSNLNFSCSSLENWKVQPGSSITPSSDTNSEAITFLMSILLYDTELRIRYPRDLYHPRAFQFDRLGADVREQPGTFAEQCGYQVNPYFVKKSGFYILLSDIRTAQHADVLVTAAAFACSTTLRMSSLTKVNADPSLTFSGTAWVRTKFG